MKGHIRRRGKHWVAVVDLGQEECRYCPTCERPRRRFWTKDDPELRACPRCGSELEAARPERRQRWLAGFDRRREAEDALADLVGAVRDGSYVVPSDETLADYLNRWLETVRPNLEDTTAENYRVTIDAYIAPHVGRVRLQDLTSDALDRLYARLLASGGRGGRPLKPKTVRNVHLVVHRALESARRKRRVPTNVAAFCEAVPRAERRQERSRRMRETVWSPAELRQFLAKVRGHRLEAAWILEAVTGLRRGELLGLPWRNLDLDDATVRIDQELVVVDHKPVLKPTVKSEESAREITLPREAVDALRAHRKRQAEERLAWGPAYQDTGLVFTREDGTPIHPERLLGWFKQLAKQAGLRPCRFHDVRHAYASALLEAGLPMKAVSERLGHAGIGITADVYAHVSRDLDREVAEAGAAFILGS